MSLFSDVDECSMNSTICSGQSHGRSYCININGDYNCVSCAIIGDKLQSYFNSDKCCQRGKYKLATFYFTLQLQENFSKNSLFFTLIKYEKGSLNC